ncbi:MAG: hypothetical protein JWM93_627 [Frankiales bacterium]|nr:hypothetical protein [Frankiales bacterium]
MTNADTNPPGDPAPPSRQALEPAATAAGNPPLLFDLRTQLGGPRGVFDSSFPGVVMAVATVVTTVPRAIVAALVAAALLALFRLARREPVRQTAMSLGGIALCYFLSRATGDTKTFFLPGILFNGAYALGLLVSLVIRRPAIGFAAAMLDARYQHWQQHAPLRRAATRATIVWVVVFALRFFVVGGLYVQKRVDLLPVTRLALGLPLYVASIGLTVLLLRPHAQAADVADETG